MYSFENSLFKKYFLQNCSFKKYFLQNSNFSIRNENTSLTNAWDIDKNLGNIK